MLEKKPRDYFHSIPLFDEFDEKQLQYVENFSSIRKYKPKERILIQGQENINLYILIIGQVGVHVDGAIVATLEQMGEVIGEMSVVTRRPVSATIVSETPVKVIEVDIQNLNKALGNDKEVFNKTLYRAFAITLSDKLRITNQKAKYFEDFSDKHLTEIYQGQELTIKRLKEVTGKNLVNLQANIKSLQNKFDTAAYENVLNEVEYIKKILDPLVSRFSIDLERQSRRVLLAESNKKQQSIAKMALGGTGIELEIASHIAEAREKLTLSDFDIVFVNSEMIPLISEFAHKIKSRFTLITSEPISAYIPKLKKIDIIPNIVSRDPDDRYFTSKNIMTTVTKLANRDIFGLEKYLAWGVDLQEYSITGSDVRAELNDQMQAYFTQLGVRSSRLDSVRTVTEELLMNAIYDAPIDSNGNSIFNHLDRTIQVKLKKSQQGTFSFGTDGMFIGISVADPFGALQGQTVIDYLESCYGGNAGSLNQLKGGAGRGLHMIVELSDLVVFNIEPGVKTEVISLFHIDGKSSDYNSANFHYFCTKAQI